MNDQVFNRSINNFLQSFNVWIPMGWSEWGTSSGRGYKGNF